MDEEYTEEEQLADNLDSMDTQQEYQDSMIDSLDANYPTQKEQQSLYSLFKWVIQRKDSSKIGNLLKQELGDVKISVRSCQELALLGKEFDNPAYASWFGGIGEITLATSLSREGFLDELFVSQKKFATKARKSSSPLTPQKWKLFNKGKTAEQ